MKDDVGKFPLMESSLFALFKERRSQGRRCSANEVKKHATKEMELHYPDLVSQFTGSQGWFVRFCKCFNLVLRKKTNKKKHSVEERERERERESPEYASFMQTCDYFLQQKVAGTRIQSGAAFPETTNTTKIKFLCLLLSVCPIHMKKRGKRKSGFGKIRLD